MEQNRSDAVRREWQTIDCPVPGCGERGPRIHIRSHLTSSDEPVHERYAENETL